MSLKLFDSEKRVMECIWDNGDMSAKEIAAELNIRVGWSKTTTYTVIKKCIEKGAIRRSDPYRTRVYVHALDKQGRSTGAGDGGVY